MKRKVLITGATSGIGEATARVFASEGDDLIITGRREERLKNLKEELEQEHGIQVIPLCFDIRERESVDKAMDALDRGWHAIDILVNNAGLAMGLDPIQESSEEDWDTMIDTNVKGLLYISSIVIPWMLIRKQGHIVNIGSIAGREVYPKGSVYCATKYAVDAITQGMRIDLVGEGIRVSQVSPGAARTEFSLVRFHGDKEKADQVYQGYEPLKAEDVAEVIRFITGLPAHVNVNDILLMPTAQASASVIYRK